MEINDNQQNLKVIENKWKPITHQIQSLELNEDQRRIYENQGNRLKPK